MLPILAFSDIYWMDVCPINENLLALAGDKSGIKIIDKREMKTVKYISDSLHSGILKAFF